MYKYLLKPIFFLFDAEKVHYFVFSLLKILLKPAFLKKLAYFSYGVTSEKLQTQVWGLNFKNPVGVAAGFDKNAVLIDELASLGFGFIEIGTLTPKPQSGNDQPRLFRIPKDKGLINRMGFNNAGVIEAIKHLKSRKSDIIIGGNIGKNKTTPNEQAIDDYEFCFNALHDYVDYFVVNVSSPNTPGLRELQEKEPLSKLLSHLVEWNNTKIKTKPILLKIAPDLTNEQLDDIVEIVQLTGIHGIVATNTTIERNGLNSPNKLLTTIGNGGVSGLPLKDRSTEVIRYISQKSNKTIPIIGVGGIFTAKDAQEKLDAGAVLVQVYTGFVYEGPGITKKICQGLLNIDN